MIKKMIAVILVFTLTLTILPLTAMASDDSTEMQLSATDIQFCDDLQTELTSVLTDALQSAFGDDFEILSTYSASFDRFGNVFNEKSSVNPNLKIQNDSGEKFVFIVAYLEVTTYYDPVTGRFVNADLPESMLLQDNILATNLFAYCGNNPVNFIDRTGYSPAQVAGAIIGGIIGVVGGYFLGNWLADLWGIKGWLARPLFVGAVAVLVGAAVATIGFFIGPYIAKAGAVFFDKIKTYCAQLIEKGKMALTKLPVSAQNFIKLTNHFAKKAANLVNKFTVSAKHLSNAGGTYAKFSTTSQATVREWIKTALSKGSNFQFNDSKSYTIIYNMGKVIGTKGEKCIKVVFDVAGNIWTAYPVK